MIKETIVFIVVIWMALFGVGAFIYDANNCDWGFIGCEK